MAGITALVLGIALISLGMFRGVNDIPVITSTAQFSENLEQIVEVRGDIRNTGISQTHNVRGDRSMRFNLYIIELDDASVAFRAVASDFEEQESVTGRVMRLQDDSIMMSLLGGGMTNLAGSNLGIEQLAPYAVVFEHSSEDLINMGVGFGFVGLVITLISWTVSKLTKVKAKKGNEAENM